MHRNKLRVCNPGMCQDILDASMVYLSCKRQCAWLYSTGENLKLNSIMLSELWFHRMISELHTRLNLTIFDLLHDVQNDMLKQALISPEQTTSVQYCVQKVGVGRGYHLCIYIYRHVVPSCLKKKCPQCAWALQSLHLLPFSWETRFSQRLKRHTWPPPLLVASYG